MELVDGTVKTWCCLESLREFFVQRLRWAIMARQARPLGYLGLIFTQGLPWTVLAAILAPSLPCWPWLCGSLLDFAHGRWCGPWAFGVCTMTC